MNTRLILVATAMVVMALAAPSTALAQAQRRGGSGSSSDSGSSGGGGGGAVTAAPRQPAAMPRPTVREPSAPSGASRPAGRAPASTGGRVTPSRGTASADQRVRSDRAAIGVAQPRATAPQPDRPGGFNPWYRWSPGYGFGYGIGYGYGYGYPYSYGVFSPWGYRSGLWGWGSWHDPFLFDPFYYGGGPYWGSGGTVYDDRDDDVVTGSIRFRVKPDHARVYIDGALAGVASEFGGLTGHLNLPPGVHDIELRADGYRTYSGQLEVREGRTRTERVTLEQQ